MCRSAPVVVFLAPGQPGEQRPVVSDRPRVVVPDRRDEFVTASFVDPVSHPVPPWNGVKPYTTAGFAKCTASPG